MYFKIKNVCLCFSIFSSTVLTSCVTRAPSQYELDKEAGRWPSQLGKKPQTQLEKDFEKIQRLKGEFKPSHMPSFIEPRVEKVWVYDQQLSDSLYFQGTYVYLRIDNGSWLGSGQ